MITLWDFLHLHIFRKEINSFQTLLKLNDNVCHERKYYRVVEVKSGRKSVVSTESERRTDWNGRRPRGERKRPCYIAERWQQSWAQYPPHPQHLSQWLLCQTWAVWQKSSSSGRSYVQLRMVWQVFCPTALSSDWQNRPAAGWMMAGEKWYRRFRHIMAVCSKTSQEIVSYWLLGGDASGLLWRCLEYDELPL